MKEAQLIADIETAIANVQAQKLCRHYVLLQEEVGPEEAVEITAEKLNDAYTSLPEAMIVGLLQEVLREDFAAGLLGFPKSPFFELALSWGSVALYKCYREEVLELFFKREGDNAADYYQDLYTHAKKYSEAQRSQLGKASENALIGQQQILGDLYQFAL